jgi:23S rRNA (uracil1939-C5)-methyltransferase
MDAWSKLRESWGPGAQRLPAGGEVRLVLREVDEGVVLLVSGGSGRCDAQALLESVPELVAVWRVHRRVPARLLAGQSEVHETWMGERVAVPVSSFSQVNKTVGELLHVRVLGLASDRPGRVVDAYAGVGLFARTLAAQGRPAVAIELDPETAAAARNGSPEGMTVLEGRVEDLINDVLPTDLMIANPPRAGLHADVAAAVCDRPPGALIYVSCDPATLARDARRMADRFDLVAVETFDLFPQTAHVETVALFEPRTSA